MTAGRIYEAGVRPFLEKPLPRFDRAVDFAACAAFGVSTFASRTKH